MINCVEVRIGSVPNHTKQFEEHAEKTPHSADVMRKGALLIDQPDLGEDANGNKLPHPELQGV